MIKWNTEKISSFTEVITGGTPSTTIREYWENGDIPWLNSGELNKGIIKESENFITELGLKNSSTRLMPINTVLVALTGSTTGVTALLKMQACANQSVTGILPSNKHFPEFLYYFLKTQRKQILGKAWGGAQPHINQKFIKDYIIPLPSFTDQIKIAQILSKAETLIHQRKQSIALLDEFLKSTFLAMFGDPSINQKKFKLGVIRDIVDDVKYGTSSPAEENGSFPYLRMNNITYDGYMDYSNMKYINFISEKEIEKYIVRKGDLIFNRTNSKELVGKTGVFNKDSEMIIAGYLIRIRMSKIANSWFLWGYLNSKHGKQTLYGMCKSIVGMANINAQELQNIKIVIPPISLQNQFAGIVEKTESIKSQYQQSLQELENLFGSLSQKAFKGELDLDKIGITEEEYSATDNDRTGSAHFVKPKTIDIVPAKAKPASAETKSTKSVWASVNPLGKLRNIDFNPIEGDAVFKKVFSKKKKGFQFSEFESFLKDEGFNADYKGFKDFIQEKLENKELIQYYSSKEWMDKNYKPQTSPLQDDFAGDGSIWLVPNSDKK